MNPIRSLMAVLGGMVILAALTRAMAPPLVRWLAGGNVTTYVGLPAAPLAGVVAVQGVAALLAGYMTARIAGALEWQHGAFLAVLNAALLIWGFLVTPEAAQVPRWMQVATVAVVGAAIFAGAAVRARAVSLHTEAAAPVRPGGRS